MKTFEIGKEYISGICKFTIKITGRTAKTVSYLYDGNARRSKIRINERKNCEYVRPDTYFMAPVFRADAEHEVQPEIIAEETPIPVSLESNRSKVITIAQTADDGTVIVIGQRVECVCGACYPVQSGTVIGFCEEPAGRLKRGGIRAVIRWENRPDVPERIRLSDIHRQGWRSAGGSPLGIFVC